MIYEPSVRKYRQWYARLLRFYPRSYYRRFGPSMEQTFADLLSGQSRKKSGLIGYTLWLFGETFVGIIKENIITTRMQYKRLFTILLAIAGLLLIPVLGRWPWNWFDFVVMGTLLLGTGLLAELVMRKVTQAKHRLVIIITLLILFLLTYLELAVGIFDSPIAGS